MPSIAERRTEFRQLHADGCFVLPNPWDLGSARYLQYLGARAVATTSAGVAFALGEPDGAVACDVMLAHIAAIVAGTDLPVNADFGNGFAEDPEQLAQHVRQCVAAGVAGLSIEDATGDRGTPLYPLAQAVERVRAARQAAGDDVVLTARAEGFLVGRPDLDDVLTRLQAFAAAGADCLYAPGLRHRDEIAAVVGAVAPKPVNVLMSAPIGFTVTDLAALGVRRVSVGSGLARAAWGGFVRAARELLARGTFEALADATPFAELDGFFTADKSRRR